MRDAIVKPADILTVVFYVLPVDCNLVEKTLYEEKKKKNVPTYLRNTFDVKYNLPLENGWGKEEKKKKITMQPYVRSRVIVKIAKKDNTT